MSKKKGNGKIIAAAVIAAGMVAGTAAAGIILPQTNYVSITCYGNNGAPVYEQRVRKNSSVSLPTPERAGCNFAGWYLDEDMTDAVTYGAKFNKNTKVYASWEVEDYAIATQASTVGITKIGAGAFKGCTGLTNVTIPASVTSIGANAFEGCNITNLYIDGDIYKTATSATALGGALAAAQNVFVKEEVELSTRNTYFLEGNTLFYLQTTNGYVQFMKDSTRETKFRIKYFSSTGLLNDEDVRYRGAAKNAPALVENTGTEFIIHEGWYISATSTAKVSLTEIRENKDAYRKQVLQVQGNSFSTCSWENIKKISALGRARECFAVGDEKKITINDTANSLTFDITIQIADFNHDVDENGNTIGMTCVTKEALPSIYKYRMNENGNAGGWHDSEMRSYLNSSILELLPSDLKSSITSAVKKSTAGGLSTALGSDSIDKLFLLSHAEINYETTTAGYKDEGTPYALYANWTTSTSSSSERIKYYADSGSEVDGWWLRSPHLGAPGWFCEVYRGGMSCSPANYPYAICFAFCI